MRFACDRCAKKYITAQEPAPGKVYRVKCRACGHLIEVKGPAPAPASAAPAGPGPGGEPVPVPARAPAPLPPEVAMAVDAAAGSPAEPPPPRHEMADPLVEAPAPPGTELTPPPPEKDELADFVAAASEVLAAPLVAGEPARASPPDRPAGALPGAASPAPRAAPPPPPSSTRAGARGMPLAVIGLGILALAGIAAWSLIGRGGPQGPAPAQVPGPTASRPAEPASLPPAPPPASAVERPAQPVPRAPVRQPGPKAEAKADPRARPADRKVERRPEALVAERRAEPPRPAAPPEPRPEPRDGEAPGGAAAPAPEVLDRVVGANRKAFAACMAAVDSAGPTLDGRRVALRITINVDGSVTDPTLDDPSLGGTELGQCLRSAALLMIFPPFQGDPIQHEVTLVLDRAPAP